MSRRIAVVQMNSTSSIEQNLRQASDLITQARLSYSQFVCLPEGCDYIVDDPTHAVSLSTGLHTSPLLQRYQTMATQSDMWISLGGMHIQSNHDTSRLQTMHILLSPHETTPLKTYSKTHLPASQYQASQPPTYNTHTTEAGNSLAIAYETPIGNVGLTVGHDLYFPSVFESLREANAHVLLTPTSMQREPASTHWKTLVRARAIETQTYIVAAAQVGTHTALRESFGHSLIVGPYGNTLVDAGSEGVGFACADIDLDVVRQVRDRMPLRKQRRDDLLGKVVRAAAV